MGKLGSRSKSQKSAAPKNIDVNTLRIGIQKLCQSTNPLGKCMDYVHEDMEMMKKEMQQWKADSDKYAVELEDAAGHAALKQLVKPGNLILIGIDRDDSEIWI